MGVTLEIWHGIEKFYIGIDQPENILTLWNSNPVASLASSLLGRDEHKEQVIPAQNDITRQPGAGDISLLDRGWY
jgi:hypothetical protein